MKVALVLRGMCMIYFHPDHTFNHGEINVTAGETYEGQFGRWSVTSEDVAEVYGYRAGLTIAAAGMGLLLLHMHSMRPLRPFASS